MSRLQGTVKRNKGFTLVELLVVISIIALLLAILMPSLSKARKQGQAIVCGVHLKQWGLAWMMYAQEYNGKIFRGMMGLPSPNEDKIEDRWYMKLQPYCDSEAMWYCPVAKRPNTKNTNDAIGGAYEAWGYFEILRKGVRTGKYAYSSYGVNSWIHNPIPADVNPYGVWDKRYFWRTINVSGADKVPLVLDAAFSGAYSANLTDNRHGGSYNAPLEAGKYNQIYSATINTFCIDRHMKSVNVVFLDFSTRRVGLKELWRQKWHRNYRTEDVPKTWPAWMAGAK